MIKKIILGSGCFWCSEAIFSMITGINKVIPGYSGGHKENPSYEEVCEGNTGHAEVVYLEYDDKIISLQEILEIFFAIHDPTSLNRQGDDVGEQYRSVIYYFDDIDLETIRRVKENKSKEYTKEIVTEIDKAKNFYPAEDYHKNYFMRNPDKPYCKYVILPKVKKVSKEFSYALNK